MKKITIKCFVALIAILCLNVSSTIGQITLGPGDNVSERLRFTTDNNRYSICGQEGEVWVIRMASEDINFPRLELYDTDGDLLQDNFSPSVARIEFKLPKTGCYTILATNQNKNEFGNYEISAQVATNPENATSTGCSITVINSLISSTAMNSHSIFLDRNSVIKIDVSSQDVTFPRIELWNPNGDFVTSEFGPRSAKIDFTASIEGCYTILLMSQNGNESGDVNITVTPIVGTCLECSEIVEPTEICNNGIDDDGDGLIDCADNDCENFETCQETPTEICDNKIDDDGDGKIDCDDGDCSSTSTCLPSEQFFISLPCLEAKPGDVVKIPVFILGCSDLNTLQGTIFTSDGGMVKGIEGKKLPIGDFRFTEFNNTVSYENTTGINQNILATDTLFFILVEVGSSVDSIDVGFIGTPMPIALTCGEDLIREVEPINGKIKVLKEACISGVILDPSGNTISNVNLTASILLDDSNVITQTTTTKADGTYSFKVPFNSEVTLTGVKNTNPLNGVTTMDLVLMRKILHFESNPDPFHQLIAMDVLKDGGSLFVHNIFEVRKLILGITQEFPHQKSWAIIPTTFAPDESFSLANVNYPEAYTIEAVKEDTNIDFTAVKFGDLNFTANPASLNQQSASERANNALKIIASAKENPNQVTYNFKTETTQNINGFQFALTYDTEALEWNGIDLSEKQFLHNIMVNEPQKGMLRIVWYADNPSPQKVEAFLQLFSLKFTKKDISKQSNTWLQFNKKEMLPEVVYETVTAPIKVAIEIPNKKAEITESPLILFQNRPNPATTQTIIPFHLSSSGLVRLKLSDIAGKIYLSQSGNFAAGNHEFSVDLNGLNAGLYLYELEINGLAQSGKLLVN